MKVLGSYQNGNYSVTIWDDGTKVRQTCGTAFEPTKPESMDLKITNRCDMGCPMCHEDSTPGGAHGDILNLPFLDTLLPYTEIAIGGGNPLSHPDLTQFLRLLKSKRLIANMTVNAAHFIRDFDRIKQLSDDGYIHGLGVSVTYMTNDLLDKLRQIPNVVLHVINGVITVDELRMMYDKGLKLLILGYKDFRRGVAAHKPDTDLNMAHLYAELPELVKHFEVVSFDNLAIRQLDPKRLMSEEEWNEFYMGDDGQFTMYVDAVFREFAKSSVSTERWPLMDEIEPMFRLVRNEQR